MVEPTLEQAPQNKWEYLKRTFDESVVLSRGSDAQSRPTGRLLAHFFGNNLNFLISGTTSALNKDKNINFPGDLKTAMKYECI